MKRTLDGLFDLSDLLLSADSVGSGSWLDAELIFKSNNEPKVCESNYQIESEPIMLDWYAKPTDPKRIFA